MFSKAFPVAAGYTRPVVISSRNAEGKCSSVIAAYIVLNRDGWILTAGHVLGILGQQQESARRRAGYRENVIEFQRDLAADKRFRKQGVRTFHPPKESAVSNHSVWWGVDGMELVEAKVRPSADLALCRLEPFDADSVPRFPVIKDPTRGYSPGRSLCNLGFPLHQIDPRYDEETNTFTLPPESVSLPMLPLDGMFMRAINRRAPGGADGETCAFIELSSPSLIGQMGGPVFDADAVVWGILSHTLHYPLGFSPPIPGARQGQVAHQFLNTGLAVHAAVIRRFLDDEGVGYEADG